MPRCDEIDTLIRKGEFTGGICYNGPAGLEWLFPTIFAVLILAFVVTWIIPATRPSYFK